MLPPRPTHYVYPVRKYLRSLRSYGAYFCSYGSVVTQIHDLTCYIFLYLGSQAWQNRPRALVLSDMLWRKVQQSYDASRLANELMSCIDVPEILAIIKELAEYEKASDSVLATEQKLLDTLSFPSNPEKGYAKTLLIFPPGPSDPRHRCAGMAMYFTNYSTWDAAPGIYLEDLFVRLEFRGRGYGTALLKRLAQETLNIGGTRLEWSVLDWNKPSIDFYKSPTVGARMKDEWLGCRVEGNALQKLGAE